MTKASTDQIKYLYIYMHITSKPPNDGILTELKKKQTANTV